MILSMKKKKLQNKSLKKLLNVLKISQKPLPEAKTKQSIHLHFIYSVRTSDSIPINWCS